MPQSKASSRAILGAAKGRRSKSASGMRHPKSSVPLPSTPESSATGNQTEPHQARQATQQIGPLLELFAGVIPSSPLAHVLREIAQQQGWAPPWEYEAQKANKKKAGVRSGISRASRAQIRLSLIKIARARLSPEQRRSPHATDSIDKLCREFRKLITLHEEALGRLVPRQQRMLERGAEARDLIDVLYERFREVLDSANERRSKFDDLVPLILASQPEADREHLRRTGRETIIKDVKLLRKEASVTR